MMIYSVSSVLCAFAGVTAAQATVPADVLATPFSLGKVFTFLFLTLGPFKVIAPFAEMVHGRDAAFKRELALRGTLVSAVGLLAAATIGARILSNWGVSPGALQLTAGIVLFLVALKPVLEQYEPKEARTPKAAEAVAAEHLPASKLAIWPLAFPTIVTPYGVAVLILMMTLRATQTSIALEILGVAAAVLVLNLLAMLSAERILRTPFVATTLIIVGMVLSILQVALGIQAILGAVPLLRLAGVVNG
jgi:multiple antibiotic resistance protein